MSHDNQDRRSTIEHAVKVEALKRLAREIGINEALAAVSAIDCTGGDGAATPRERAAARQQAHRADVVAEIVRLEKDGRARAAASIVARMHAADLHDPIEIETLTNKFRRWRRAQKRANARFQVSR